MVDPLEYDSKGLDQIIKDTTLVAWYFNSNPSIGNYYIDGRLSFDEALSYAKVFKETTETIAEHGGCAGEA